MSFLAVYLAGIIMLAALFGLAMYAPRLGLALLADVLIASAVATQYLKQKPQNAKTTCLYCT